MDSDDRRGEFTEEAKALSREKTDEPTEDSRGKHTDIAPEDVDPGDPHKAQKITESGREFDSDEASE